ncbi:beta/gamma crystallin domain-containing protein [Psychromicrobium sp. YIM B11713]|uniref:beta/gamma crystallin domain-containing protein n=1 Tax=Psychromicrobium sp. YIM B11713 TaxID=3145233 RepID=UPI00374E67C7
MAFDFKKAARKTLVASVVAGAVLVAVPAVGASTASANEVGNCFDKNYVHLYWHSDFNVYGESCYANRGNNDINAVWADRITTGNNNIQYRDFNGSYVDIDAYHDVSWADGHEPHLLGLAIK